MATTPDFPATGGSTNTNPKGGSTASGSSTGAGSSIGGGSGSGLGGTSSSTLGAGTSSSLGGSSSSGLGGDRDMGLEAGAALAGDTSTTPLDTAGPSSFGSSSGSTGGASGSSFGGASGASSGNAGSEASAAAQNRRAEARSRFAAALEEARAGLEALRADAAERGANYRAMATGNTSEWVGDVKAMSGSARKRAEDLAKTGKTRASDGLSALGRIFTDTASVIDDRLGPKYGDYARGAARSVQESAARLESKELTEIGDDVRDFVRKSPGTAIGIAAVSGFFIARLLGAGRDKD